MSSATTSFMSSVVLICNVFNQWNKKVLVSPFTWQMRAFDSIEWGSILLCCHIYLNSSMVFNFCLLFLKGAPDYHNIVFLFIRHVGSNFLIILFPISSIFKAKSSIFQCCVCSSYALSCIRLLFLQKIKNKYNRANVLFLFYLTDKWNFILIKMNLYSFWPTRILKC